MRLLSCLLLSLSLVIGLAEPRAQARSIGPTGYGDLGTGNCWNHSYMTVTNCGAGYQNIFWQLPVDNGGAKTVTVSVDIANGGWARCSAIAVDTWGATSTVGSVQRHDGSGLVQLTSTGASVPNGGFLIAQCDLSQGTSVSAINWNP